MYLKLLYRPTNTLTSWPRPDQQIPVGLNRELYYVVEVIQLDPPTPGANQELIPIEPIINITDPNGTTVNGTVTLGWELVDVPPPPPQPNWDLFEALAIRDTAFDSILGMGLQPGVAPAASVTLGDSMREIKIRGEVAVPSFRNSWTRLCRRVNAPQEEIQRFAGAAIACNLPDYFIQAILAPIPEE